MSSGSSIEVVPLSSSSSNAYSIISHVSYSCGTCGYELNLNSCNRNISMIDETYGKSMKRGVISFFSIDESRFTQVNKFRWLTYLAPKKNKNSSWRLFQRRTKLLCRNCGNYIGSASNSTEIWDGISSGVTYEIKIRTLRPMVSFEGSSLLI